MVSKAKKPTLNQIWKEVSKDIKITVPELNNGDTPQPSNTLRCVCMSDTHGMSVAKLPQVPDGDIFIHAGDFTNVGEIKDVKYFNSFLKTLPHKYKVVIAGNHDLCFDLQDCEIKQHYNSKSKDVEYCKKARKELSDCIYLEDSSVEIEGYNFYGSPYSAFFYSWAFNLHRGEPLLKKWKEIPDNTEILITHGPPLGFGDILYGHSENHCGEEELLSQIRDRVKPLYHIFGHIHEGYGIWNDGTTTYINASTNNYFYKPVNPAIVFDLPIKQ